MAVQEMAQALLDLTTQGAEALKSRERIREATFEAYVDEYIWAMLSGRVQCGKGCHVG
jgi:hypothetical protein